MILLQSAKVLPIASGASVPETATDVESPKLFVSGALVKRNDGGALAVNVVIGPGQVAYAGAIVGGAATGSVYQGVIEFLDWVW